MNKLLTDKIKKIIIEQLDLPNDEEKERIRIEIYKTLENSVSSMELNDHFIKINLEPLKEVLSRYNLALLYWDIQIPIVRKFGNNTNGR